MKILEVMSECRTYLVYYINKDLRIVSKKATDRITLIFAREDRFYQGGEFM